MTIKKKKYKIRFLLATAAAVFIFRYSLNLPFFQFLGEYQDSAKRLTMSVFLIIIVLLIERVLKRMINTQAETEGVKYNLQRISRLVTIALILLIIASFLFQNLYAIAVSFGLISLILGFALQAPITSFIAWLFIVFRRPFRVGDRIQIDGFKGDVIEIGYLDTILEECSGVYLGNDRKSGRLVHFPNSVILRSEVVNYAGPFGPFIWNETALQIAFTSDLKFVEACLLEVASADFAIQHPDNQQRGLEPEVYFRVNNYAWLEAVISYPVFPSDTTGKRNRILKQVLPLFNAHPEKVQFPDGANR